MTITARLLSTYQLPDKIPVLTSSGKPAFPATRQEAAHLIRCDTVVGRVHGKKIKYLELVVAPDFAWVPRVQAPSLSPAQALTIESIIRHRTLPRTAPFIPNPFDVPSGEVNWIDVISTEPNARGSNFWSNCYPSYPIPDERTCAQLT